MKIHFFKSFFLSKLFSVTSLCVENSKLSFWTPSHFKIWPKCYFALLTDAHVGLSRRCTKNGFRSKRSEKFSWPLAFESHLQLACWMILWDQLIRPGQASARAGVRSCSPAGNGKQQHQPIFLLSLIFRAVTAAAAVSACVRCHDRQPRGTGSHGSYLREYTHLICKG